MSLVGTVLCDGFPVARDCPDSSFHERAGFGRGYVIERIDGDRALAGFGRQVVVHARLRDYTAMRWFAVTSCRYPRRYCQLGMNLRDSRHSTFAQHTISTAPRGAKSIGKTCHHIWERRFSGSPFGDMLTGGKSR
jgi:hypothetical protein